MLIYIIAVLCLIIFFLVLLYRRAWHELNALKYSKQSLASKYGKMTEQFMPFIKDYPYDPQSFRFLGNPIDGVQFEPDRVVFVEFKSGDSRLSAKQKAIKDLILDKKVEFREVRINDDSS